jgi:hypothetical protein
MLKKQFGLLFLLALIFPLAQAVLAQEAAPAKVKEDTWEGKIQRTNKDNSTLTVRKADGSADMTIVYDSSTKWVSQYHGSKNVNDIDSSQVKEGDYVICKGSMGKDGKLHATLISKRLSHSQ